jgi:hypothetical protein
MNKPKARIKKYALHDIVSIEDLGPDDYFVTFKAYDSLINQRDAAIAELKTAMDRAMKCKDTIVNLDCDCGAVTTVRLEATEMKKIADRIANFLEGK